MSSNFGTVYCWNMRRTREKITKNSLSGLQGRSRSSMNVSLESSSAVLWGAYRAMQLNWTVLTHWSVQFRSVNFQYFPVRLAVDMDMDIHGHIHGYINVWISDFSHSVDTSMDIMLAHLLIKLNTNVLCFSITVFCLSLLIFIFSFIHVIESNKKSVTSARHYLLSLN